MSKVIGRYSSEIFLLAAVSVLTILGFWDIYLGADANPQPRHHLHLTTIFVWLSLLLIQLILVSRRDFRFHRQLGLAVLFIGPLLVASNATLSVLSARRSFASGQADALIAQNVVGTFGLGVLVLLAFLLKRHRMVHGSLLFSTLIQFGGIALFFTLLSFVPMFRIEGPETFYRFATAATTGLIVWLAVAALLFASSPKTRWPYLLAAAFLLLNEAMNYGLESYDLSYAATARLGALDPALTFAAVFAIQFVILFATLFPRSRRSPADTVRMRG